MLKNPGMSLPSLSVPERLLLGPGPSNSHPLVLEALSRQPVGHLDPFYIDLMAEVQGLLRDVWQTSNRLTLPMSGTGSAAMEATIANIIEPGETFLVGINGYFKVLKLDSRNNNAITVPPEASNVSSFNLFINDSFNAIVDC